MAVEAGAGRAAAVEIKEGAVEGLRAALRGGALVPDSPGYEQARKVYNAMIDKRPACIVRCVDVADVITALGFAREQGLEVAVRGGGHNGAGLGTVDGGLVIDLSPMRGVRVDPQAQVAQVAGGSLLGDLDHATGAFGLATPSGILSTTGVAGLTLGGGLGYLTRRYGLSIDNLLAVDLVLADGTFVTASADQHEDLFWAVRGGGGNFGIATSFTFRLHPVATVVGGPMLWGLDQAAEVLRCYREFLPAAPVELSGWFAFLTVPPAPPFPEQLHLQKMCGVLWCWSGAVEGADEALAPVRQAIPPALDGVMAMPYPALQSAFDALYPPGLQWYWRADFVKQISDQAIDAHLEYAAQLPSMHSTMHLYPIDGAVHQVGRDETAWSYRDATWAQVIVGVDPDPANRERLRDWAVDYWQALHPHSMGGAYVNFLMDEGQDRVLATYRDNYQRLAAIKRRHDPDNLFHVNQNIRPAA
jgi:FAD binding domain/Berberine and berberine like